MTEEQLLHEVDDQLLLLTKKLHIIKYLTPTNLSQEREYFVEMKGEYDPQFTYNFPDEKEIIQHCKVYLSPYKVPREVVFVPEIFIQ